MFAEVFVILLGFLLVASSGLPSAFSGEEPPEPAPCTCDDIDVDPDTDPNTNKRTKKSVPRIPDGSDTLERIKGTKFKLIDIRDWDTLLLCEGEKGECSAKVKLVQTAAPIIVFNPNACNTANVRAGNPPGAGCPGAVKLGALDPGFPKIRYTAGDNKDPVNKKSVDVTCNGTCPNPPGNPEAFILPGTFGDFKTKYILKGDVILQARLDKPMLFVIQYEIQVACDGDFVKEYSMKHWLFFDFNKGKFTLNQDVWTYASDWDGDGRINGRDASAFG